MSHKSVKYGSKEDVDEMDSLSERLGQDLRKHIRLLSNAPVLSDAWLETAEIFGRIANISDMESKISESKSANSTLWETEEQALRFLMEDGKLNLSLRSMVDFKAMQRFSINAGTQESMAEYAAQCDKFEKGLGVVLRNAWNHVEVVQTTDLQMLLQHIVDVLDSCFEHTDVILSYCRNGDIHQRQEILVFYYLASVMRFVEDVSESRIMPFLRSENVFMKGVRVFLIVYQYLANVHQLKMLEALGSLTDTEDFRSYRERYVANADDGRSLLELKSAITPLMINPEIKRMLRSLVDCIDRSKRQFRL